MLRCHIGGMTTPLAYLNGAWIPSRDLAIPIDDLGFLLGSTVVERLRTFGGQVFRTTEHLERLRRSLEIVGWDADALCSEIKTVLQDFGQQNVLQFVAGDDWSLVSFITPGSSPAAVEPTVCVHGNPLPFHDWVDYYSTGVKAAIVNTRQVPENCWPSELKCRSRLHYYLADREAHAIGPGARGILLDQDGYICEGTTANVVAYFENRGLVTPCRTKVLPGVSQQVLYELAASLGIAQAEEDLLPAELARANEIFLTSTSSCLLPVTEFNGQAVGTGKPGKVFAQLLSAWSEMVGVDIAEQAQRFTARRD